MVTRYASRLSSIFYATVVSAQLVNAMSGKISPLDVVVLFLMAFAFVLNTIAILVNLGGDESEVTFVFPTVLFIVVGATGFCSVAFGDFFISTITNTAILLNLVAISVSYLDNRILARKVHHNA